MKQIGLGLIGLGYIGKIHLQNCLDLRPYAKLEAVADISKKALNQTKKFGVKKAYQDYSQVLKDPNVDAVIIALPTHLHATCAEAAAEAEKQVFLEKPLARNVAEAQRIISAAQKNSVKLMIGYPLRFNDEFRALKGKITNGSLGNVEIARATNISCGPFFHREQSYAPTPVPEWWFNKELTG
ncbi:MAG TPA: Gfo/Idh/MocA family oxidoreductase, partial [Acidobacteriota bacterium]|nr:Gfo/Idh/MocA family oxidoreductase [Acidobacteriota bacterium]